MSLFSRSWATPQIFSASPTVITDRSNTSIRPLTLRLSFCVCLRTRSASPSPSLSLSHQLNLQERMNVSTLGWFQWSWGVIFFNAAMLLFIFVIHSFSITWFIRFLSFSQLVIFEKWFSTSLPPASCQKWRNVVFLTLSKLLGFYWVIGFLLSYWVSIQTWTLKHPANFPQPSVYPDGAWLPFNTLWILSGLVLWWICRILRSIDWWFDSDFHIKWLLRGQSVNNLHPAPPSQYPRLYRDICFPPWHGVARG